MVKQLLKRSDALRIPAEDFFFFFSQSPSHSGKDLRDSRPAHAQPSPRACHNTDTTCLPAAPTLPHAAGSTPQPKLPVTSPLVMPSEVQTSPTQPFPWEPHFVSSFCHAAVAQGQHSLCFSTKKDLNRLPASPPFIPDNITPIFQ